MKLFEIVEEKKNDFAIYLEGEIIADGFKNYKQAEKYIYEETDLGIEGEVWEDFEIVHHSLYIPYDDRS